MDTLNQWHYANGKVILFGEHAVVYGVEAIAAAIPNAIRARILSSEKFPEGVAGQRRLTIPDWKLDMLLSSKRVDPATELLGNMCDLIISAFDPNHQRAHLGFHLRIESQIPPASGMGASAGVAVAAIKALATLFGCALDLKQVNRLAYQCEQIAHGSPSGLDNTLATYGGALKFWRTTAGVDAECRFESLVLGGPLTLIVTHSGKKGFTAETVARVRRNKEQYPEKHTHLFIRMAEISSLGQTALALADWPQFARLLNENQQCLRELGVSCEEIERVLTIALESGAEGAKLTGSGDGGALIVSAGEAESRVQTALEKHGLMSMILTIT